MKRFLDRVTITGADDSTEPQQLLAAICTFPFVEVGILVSKRAPIVRFPSIGWHRKLYEAIAVAGKPVQLSMHICGTWMMEICRGQWTIFGSELQLEHFQRLQFNFSPYFNNIVGHDFAQGIRENLRLLGGKELIFQLDPEKVDVAHWLDISAEIEEMGLKISILYDQSGGNGILPNDWQNPIGEYVGFAGGLTPENLTANLEKIEATCLHEQKCPCWIDVESGVRFGYAGPVDTWQAGRASVVADILDLGRVVQFIQQAEPWVIK